jgi:hypothetical protein
MRITSKGQVTIPLRIRQKLGLHPIQRCASRSWATHESGKSLERRAGVRGSSPTQRTGNRMTTDEILALTRR